MACRRGDRAGKAACTDGLIYLAFLAVGTSCGWFVLNGLSNLIANEPAVAQGGKMMGEVALVGAVVSLILCGCYLLWLVAFGKPSRRAEQGWSTAIIVLGVVSFVLLAVAWDADPPGYPVVLTIAVTGAIVGNASILMLFPLISTYYGGWLVAPVRAGTDISSMFTAFLAELQSPDGVVRTFPTWLLFIFYSLISCLGLVAWALILRRGIGLRGSEKVASQKEACKQESKAPGRSDEEENGSEVSRTTSEEEGIIETSESHCLAQLSNLQCPRHLLMPVVLASLTQITQWSLACTLGQIGAEMTDPVSCDGDVGRHTWRLSLTLSQILVPLGSLFSSVAACPRQLYAVLCFLQYLSCFLICTSVVGMWRGFWTGGAGPAVFIACFAVCGGLEGYLITMAYRYIGDAPSVPKSLKHSAGALLGLLTVLVVNSSNIFLGGAVTAEQIACQDP